MVARQFHYHTLRLLGAALAAACLLSIEPAQAFVPPAGSWPIIPIPAACEVIVDLTAPVKDRYVVPTDSANPEVVSIKASLRRTKGLAGKIRATIPIDSNYFNITSITTSPGAPIVTVEKDQPLLTFRSEGAVAVNQSVDVIISFKLRTGDLGIAAGSSKSIIISAAVASLNSANAETTCSKRPDSLEIVFDHGPATPGYDLEPRLTHSVSQALIKNDVFSVTGKVHNNGSDAVPAGRNYAVTVSYPTTLTLETINPATPCGTTTTSGNTVTRRCTGYLSSSVASGSDFPTAYQPRFKVNADAVKYPVELCVEPLADMETEEDPDINNCTTTDFKGNPVRISKTWEDGSTVTKSNVQGGRKFTFKIVLTNTSANRVEGLELADRFITNESCNTVINTTCADQEWDRSVAWEDVPADATLDEATQEIRWNDPITLQPNETKTIELRAQVADQATLDALFAAGKTANRCNVDYVRWTENDSLSYAKLCWKYLPTNASDVGVTKDVYKDNVKVTTADIRAGGSLTYAMTLKNTGQNATTGLNFRDEMVLGFDAADGDPLVRWDTATLPAGMTADDTDHTLTGWKSPELASGASETVYARFALACDAYDRIVSNKAEAYIENQATASAGNDRHPENDASRKVIAKVVDGHTNLTGFGYANPLQVVPQSTSQNTTFIYIALYNSDTKQTVTGPIPSAELRLELPVGFEDARVAGDTPHRTEGQTIIFDRKSVDVPVNSSYAFGIHIRAKTSLATDRYELIATAESLGKGKNCGTTKFTIPVDVSSFDVDAIKDVVSPTTKTISVGEEATYSLTVRNRSQYDINETIDVVDPFDPRLVYTQTEGCTEEGTGATLCTDPVFDEEGSQISWKLSRLPANSSVTYTFGVTVRDDLTLAECPEQVANSTVTRQAYVQIAGSKPKPFDTELIGIVADRCLDGSIYSRSDNGITVSEGLVINPNSILSAAGRVECGTNQTCVTAPYKFGNYRTQEASDSIGLKWESVVTRMDRNRLRLEKTATALTDELIDGTSFNLYGEGQSVLQYPEGRVWVRNGDLTIKTDELKLTGRGTIIVRGDLKIEGSGGIEFVKDLGSIGFIVLPRPDGTGGNVTIGPEVSRLMAIAIYAPGTADGVASHASADSGKLTVEVGSVALRPARGLFMARQFNLPRERKASFEYDASLNSAAGAPPGFSFTTSPSETQEGS